jgi:hypothetical protein
VENGLSPFAGYAGWVGLKGRDERSTAWKFLVRTTLQRAQPSVPKSKWSARAPGEQDVASLALRYRWFDDASVHGLTAGGKEYLDHVLSNEQLSLYRVVTRDAHRFPELGRRYQKEVVSGRAGIFVKYIDRCARTNKWKVKGPRNAGNVFEALLRAGVFEEVLHGIRTFEKKDIVAHARLVANVMWELVQVEVL